MLYLIQTNYTCLNSIPAIDAVWLINTAAMFVSVIAYSGWLRSSKTIDQLGLDARCRFVFTFAAVWIDSKHLQKGQGGSH